jgi:cell division protein FtsI (penicillin-binding protein 3)
VSVSAIQLASAVNAIANGGILMRPYVVQAVVDAAGNDVKRFEPEALRRVVSVDTARTVARIMETVTTEGGTGENVALDGYSVAGKTGTAQKTSNGGAYVKGLYVSSFVGFVPADDPKATIVVIVDEPRTEHYGGTVAGPAFRKIAEGLLQHMNVPPADMPLKPTLETTDQLTVSREFGVRG